MIGFEEYIGKLEQSASGSEMIECLQGIQSMDTTAADLLAVLNKVAPEWVKVNTAGSTDNLLHGFEYYGVLVGEFLSGDAVEKCATFDDLFLHLLAFLVVPEVDDKYVSLWDVPQSAFEPVWMAMPLISMWLYSYFPMAFLPHFAEFCPQSLEQCGIDLPARPEGGACRDLCRWYCEVCAVLHQWRESGDVSEAQLCAAMFLHGHSR